MDQVAERLAELRERRALTLRELAQMSGVAADTINQIELGHRKARPSTLRKLARALEIDVQEFYAEPALGKAEAPLPGPPLWEKLLNAAREDEETDSRAMNRAAAGLGYADVRGPYAEDRVRAELRTSGFPDEYFEDPVWRLVTDKLKAEHEIERLRAVVEQQADRLAELERERQMT
jgi:transcriptional regulator with XRE-family HTH domain